jgi:2-oxoglutarate dehydrogenase E2 component (dihydrolipoamide succinyltransferase)
MEIRIPLIGESVIEALVAKWHKSEGSFVQKDELICEIETDKIALDLYAEAAGCLTITILAGTTLPVGSVIGWITEGMIVESVEEAATTITSTAAIGLKDAPTSPVVRQVLREQGLDAEQVVGSGPGGRILKNDLCGAVVPDPVVSELVVTSESVLVKSEESPVYQVPQVAAFQRTVGGEKRIKSSSLRKGISERLLLAHQQTAVLTTYNEVDLGALQALRDNYKQTGDPIGLLPFFVRAVVEAVGAYPAVNARIDDDDIVYHHSKHLGIAISSENGLMVPVLRDAEQLRLRDIDKAVAGFVEKISTNQLTIADQEGGTFSISNGGTYGSMLSTPLIIPPQIGVLGMHAILDRPVAWNGQVVVRPMMYLALSYDHHLIDGREAVGFLKLIKEQLENTAWLAGLN